MKKYYTRACNFFYGDQAKKLINKKLALPLCGNNTTAFDKIEVFIRNKRNIKSKFIYLKDIKRLSKIEQSVIKKDLKKITSKRFNFLKNIDFSKPSIMGVLNLTPDSFSDGGQFNKGSKSFAHILKMINEGAVIIDVGGESTRPGSKTLNSEVEWKRVQHVVKTYVCLSIQENQK